MPFSDFLKLEKIKVLLASWLFLFFYFSEWSLDVASVIRYAINKFYFNGINIPVWYNTALPRFLILTADVIINLLFFYLVACLLLFIYSKIPDIKFKEFFRLTPQKETYMFRFFLAFVVFAFLSAMLGDVRVLGTIISLISMFFGADDVTIIHYLYRGGDLAFSKLSSLALAIAWWYLLSSIIAYFKNRKISQKR